MSLRMSASRVFLGLLAGILALGVLPVEAQTRSTRVTGVVRDEVNAVPLPGVPVEVAGTSQVAYTDVDGRYTLDLAPGKHEVRVVMEGYNPEAVAMTLAGERLLDVDFNLRSSRFAETVTVTAQAVTAELASASAQLTQRRNAQVITDNLGAQEMRASGDTNAAAAMERVTGLSVVDSSYVFVRGLGERYSNTTLNGAVIPTTEPDKKVVPLDLFPSGLLSSVSVTKSYTPDRSAEFAGGLVEVVPLKFPNRTSLDLSWSLGFNSLTSGEDVPGYAGGGRDWLGYDDGARALPATVTDEKVIRGGIFTPDVGVLQSELAGIGASFANNWNILNRSGLPNQSGGLTFGTQAGKLGLLVSYSQSYKEQFTDERQIFYRAGEQGLSVFSDYDFEVATRRANVGTVGNLSYRFSPTHRLTWENFYTHSGKDEARTFEGFNSDINTDIRNQRLFWVEEDLVSSGVTGEHFFRGIANSRIDWRFTYSDASREEPDLREVLYERNAGEFVLADESQSGLRMFNALNDDTKDFTANWGLFGSLNNMAMHVKFGAQYVERTRDFDSRRFRFVPINTSGIDLTATPEALYTASNINNGVFEIKEETRVTDSYAAEQTTASFYGMVDLAFSPRARMIAGARVENFDQQVDTFDLFDFDDPPGVVRARIEETDIFPGVNFVFSPRIDQNIRVSFSQTVNRPEFRELAEFEFTDIVGGRGVVGNPDLTRTLIQNYDVRWELFPGAEEVIAASFFYKNFNDPIERVIQATAQLRTSFDNADSARNAGFELEAQKRFSDRFLVGANYTFVDSKVTLSPAAAQVQTSLERPLAGQSKNLFNLMFEARAGQSAVRVLYNFLDDRISDVGAFEQPDVIEEARGTLDLVLSTRVMDRLNLRFSVDNLTDADYEFTQGGQLQRLFNLGRTFAFTVGYQVF